MTKKMKAIEIANMIQRLQKMRERENKYLEEKKELKFPIDVSVAIAKNSNKLMEEYEIIIEQERKNEKLAKEKKVEMEDLKEQKELIEKEFELELCTVTEEEIRKCNATSEDIMILLTFTEKG